jgi:hypothetical protein
MGAELNGSIYGRKIGTDRLMGGYFLTIVKSGQDWLHELRHINESTHRRPSFAPN